jgi:hypothetical protein
MTCTERIAELVECARHEMEPRRGLRAHLSDCVRCAERWDAERQLTDRFRSIRMAAESRPVPDEQRQLLLARFALAHPARQPRRAAGGSWMWALGAAAALLLAIYAGHLAGTRHRPAHSPVVRTHQVRSNETVLYEASTDASALSSDDFIAVPYAPPLAQGEIVRVVHTDLYPEALASLGIGVDPLSAGDTPADLVVGEDGIPRAVRITEAAQQ